MDIQSDFDINIPDIKFVIDEITSIELSPETYYNVVDDTILVVIYNITYKNNVQTILKAKIPYYISNGETNGLRLNSLLPFICFDTKEYSNCIQTGSDSSILIFKYGLYKNINLKLYEPYLNTQVVDTDEIDELKYKYPSTGLMSFLVRVESLIDLILCLSSNKLNLFNKSDITTQYLFIPYYENNIIKYNEKFSIQGNLNDKSLDSNRRFTEYRHYLLDLLLKLKNKFFRNPTNPTNPLFVLTYKKINIKEFNNITRVQFNKTLTPRICEDGELTIDSINNTINYYSISDILTKELLKKRPDLKDIIIINQELEKYTKDKKTTPLHNIVKYWLAECKKNIKHHSDDE